MSKIEAVREGAAGDAARLEAATRSLPACKPPEPGKTVDDGCLAGLATALGSRIGFRMAPADQAGAATVAVLLARDKMGYGVPRAEVWQDLIKSGKGTGVDALRVAIARGMARAAPTIGRKTEDEKVALSMMLEIARVIPGACSTYFLLGSGKDNGALPPELRAEHSPCVHKHLSLRDGPGARYGEGTWRAAEGAMALWRETERALRQGLPGAQASARDDISADLRIIEDATQKHGLKKLQATVAADVMQRLAEAHGEAGVPLSPIDAGKSDGGLPSEGGGALPR